MYICLQIFIAGVALLYTKMDETFVGKHALFQLGSASEPSLFGAYKRKQEAHVSNDEVAIPARAIDALQGDQSAAGAALRQVLGFLPALLARTQQRLPSFQGASVALQHQQTHFSPGTDDIIQVWYIS